MKRIVHGILLLDKPLQLTSNGALQKVKRLFNAKKAGHTGSLDPIATGMLPICFGEATKFSQFLLESNKSYQVTARLGIETTTGDTEGEVSAVKPITTITSEGVQAVLQQFMGAIEQIPPMFSAVKYQGKPLYTLARQGIEIERAPRKVTIFSLTFESLQQDELHFSVHCSKGTYVRTLVEDIGRKLGCGAHVIGLRRTSISGYHNSLMYSLAELETIAAESSFRGLERCLLSVETAVQVLPAVQLSAASAFYLRMGQAIRTSQTAAATLVRLLNEENKFLGIGEVQVDGRIKPYRLVSTAH